MWYNISENSRAHVDVVIPAWHPDEPHSDFCCCFFFLTASSNLIHSEHFDNPAWHRSLSTHWQPSHVHWQGRTHSNSQTQLWFNQTTFVFSNSIVVRYTTDGCCRKVILCAWSFAGALVCDYTIHCGLVPVPSIVNVTTDGCCRKLVFGVLQGHIGELQEAHCD